MIKSGIFKGVLYPTSFLSRTCPLSELTSLTKALKTTESVLTRLSISSFWTRLTIYVKGSKQQTVLLSIGKTFSDDIRIEFGLKKCAKVSFKSGTLAETSDLQIDTDICIKELDKEGTFKYLGVSEGDGIRHFAMIEKVQ